MGTVHMGEFNWLTEKVWVGQVDLAITTNGYKLLLLGIVF